SYAPFSSKNSIRLFFTQIQSLYTFLLLLSVNQVRMTYCEGELEIMGIGLQHEMISSLLGLLLGYYFVLKRIRFTSTGAYTQKIEPSLEFQADLSFAFGNDPCKD
ncbi:MAG: hypothetical protein ACK451_16330, partial [Pseudanabaena sp.]